MDNQEPWTVLRGQQTGSIQIPLTVVLRGSAVLSPLFGGGLPTSVQMVSFLDCGSGDPVLGVKSVVEGNLGVWACCVSLAAEEQRGIGFNRKKPLGC